MYKSAPHTMLEPTQGSIEKYYYDQAGGSLPVYIGSRLQSGHGIGTILSKVASVATPLLRNVAKPFLKKVGRSLFRKGKVRAKKAAFGMARDYMLGKNTKKAFKKRGYDFLGIKPPNKKRKKHPKRLIRRQSGGKRRHRRRKTFKRKTIFG
jgi:hypothetical protein